MSCPHCSEPIIWENTFTCEEVFFCDCGYGIVTYWGCNNCASEIQVTTDCINKC